MTEYSVNITKLAERDIFEAVSYVQDILFQPTSAKRLYFKIKEKISSLSAMPSRYAVISEDPYASLGIRKTTAENYLIFYSIDEKAKNVSIIRVLYNRREWHNLI